MKKLIISIALFCIAIIPAFSQVFRNNDCRVFKYTTIKDSNRTITITGVWTPQDIDGISIMCIPKEYGSDFYMLHGAIHSECWVNNIKELKNLFIKYSEIAKENEVSSDIRKNLDDKFTWIGKEGAGEFSWANIGNYSSIIPQYRCKDGNSSIVLYEYKGNSSSKIFVFTCEEDFDIIINALDWTNFQKAKEEQVQKWAEEEQEKQNAAEKKKRELDLFN